LDLKDYFFVRAQKKTFSIPVSGKFFIRKTDEISRTLRLMRDGMSVDQIQPKHVGYFGTSE
jgi:hypothetical protein